MELVSFFKSLVRGYKSLDSVWNRFALPKKIFVSEWTTRHVGLRFSYLKGPGISYNRFFPQNNSDKDYDRLISIFSHFFTDISAYQLTSASDKANPCRNKIKHSIVRFISCLADDRAFERFCPA